MLQRLSITQRTQRQSLTGIHPWDWKSLVIGGADMICTITTAKITAGYGEEAWEYARSLVKIAKEKHKAQIDYLQPIAGDNYEITWIAKYESLAAMEKFQRAFSQDPEYHAAEKRRKGPTFSDMRTSIYTVGEV